MPGAAKIGKKEAYHSRLCDLLEKHDRAFIVHADNVGSMQFQNIRKGLRPASTILMGKNTMMKRSIRLYCEQTGNDKWAVLLEHLVGNVGIVFTTTDLSEVKAEINKYKVGAPARVGVVAPVDVKIPAGPTGMDPSQTSFFQALGIATKINKGTIEIVSDVNLIKIGDKVGASQATLLSKLGIKPFQYGLEFLKVYEGGSLYDPKVLEITDEDMLGAVAAGIANIAALSLAIGYPTLASIPHSVINGYKNVLAIALVTDYSFPLADKVKEILADPSKFVVAAAAAAPAAGAAPAKKEEPKKEESEEEDMGFSLFD
mmetsp:Transcript_26696/g.58205  ORF Transcript_26696/g.58205 Transcript_26696/m.58205 type:complete len:315 (+) Transcript_26696:98-1042(+)|eukprot:CAMPEP_0202892786 /NCGR_PEP_ID=MMETSP1392-20130828/2468_1 /ASSEMBLY_ACC=CAM_ASM_000868 /TAXON_ID=225041 /ORGANISM="Chlamydomonas chlamydogama, Strain SAG 11-48b" /LENGTH=314 /DNA_ID=CAMNT_0049576873 /DNA_START=105 /DNA_END=1049 /DNA_ORIENTATION=-